MSKSKPKPLVCRISPSKPKECSGECRGATIHRHWESCGFGQQPVTQEKSDGE